MFRKNISGQIAKALVCCLFSFFVGAVAAQNAPLCPPRPIVFGLYEFGQYYHMGVGLDKDMADEIAVRSGCKFDMQVLPRSRIWVEIQAGHVDMTLSALKTDERMGFSWMLPYLHTKNLIILSKDVDPNIHSLKDFLATPYLRLGVVRSFRHGKHLDEFVDQLRGIGRVEDANDSERLYAMMKAKRFDALIGSQLVYPMYLNDFQLTDKVRVEDWDADSSNALAHIMLSKKTFTEAQAQHWNELLKAMTKDGTMLRLVSKYVPKEDAEKMLEH